MSAVSPQFNCYLLTYSDRTCGSSKFGEQQHVPCCEEALGPSEVGWARMRLPGSLVILAAFWHVPLARCQGCGAGDEGCPCVSSFDGFNVSNSEKDGVPRAALPIAPFPTPRYPTTLITRRNRPSQLHRELLQPIGRV